MAYFPNGTSGMRFEEQWCDNCQHQTTEDNLGCSVWGAHTLMNYQQLKEANIAARTLLNILIPMDKDGIYPLKCTMFLPNGDCKGQMKLWG